MNGSSRHTQHHKHQPRPSQRRRLRRRHQILTILIIIGIVLLVLTTVFLIIGARMHKKSVALRSQESVTESEIEAPATPEVPKIVAYALDRSSPSLSLKALVKQEKNAASLSLNHTSLSTLSALSAEAKKSGLYLSGVFTLTSLSEEDDLVRFQRLSEDCVTLSEALRAGLNEVVLLVPALSAERTEDLKALLSDLRRLVPDACVGLALPHEFLSEENAAAIDDLAKHFSLLAADLSLSEDLNASLEEDLYLLLRYSMRVLLPSADSEDAQEPLLQSVRSHSIENIQFLP